MQPIADFDNTVGSMPGMIEPAQRITADRSHIVSQDNPRSWVRRCRGAKSENFRAFRWVDSQPINES